MNLLFLTLFLFVKAMKGFSLKGIPGSVSGELKDRLVAAGFVNEKLQITPLPINHDGKRGKLVW